MHFHTTVPDLACSLTGMVDLTPFRENVSLPAGERAGVRVMREGGVTAENDVRYICGTRGTISSTCREMIIKENSLFNP